MSSNSSSKSRGQFGHGKSNPTEKQSVESPQPQKEHDPTINIIIFLALTIGLGIPVGRYVGLRQNQFQERSFIQDRVIHFQKALDSYFQENKHYPNDPKVLIPNYTQKMIGVDYQTRFLPEVKFEDYATEPKLGFSLSQGDCTIRFEKTDAIWQRHVQSMKCDSLLDALNGN